MPSIRALLKPLVATELAAAWSARRRSDAAEAWRRLERAHILSQPSAWLHTRVHWAMLITAALILDLREVAGQLLRIAVAGAGSALGRYPVGNPGRARISATKPMPVPDDLARMLASARAPRTQALPERSAG